MTGLGIALNSLVSSLDTTQSRIKFISDNIANAENESYVKRSLSQTTIVADGNTVGVTTTEVRREVDEFLNAVAYEQSSVTSQSKVKAEIHDRLQNFTFGDPDSAFTINNTMNSLFTAIEAYANDPSSSIKKNLVVTEAENLVSTVNSIAVNLQEERYNADIQLSNTLDEANEILNNLQDINAALKQASTLNGDAQSLLDARDTQIKRFREIFDANLSYDQFGAVSIVAGNQEILNATQVANFFYTPANSPTLFSNNGALNAITVANVDGDGNAIGSSTTYFSASNDSNAIDIIPNGEIRALIDMRDNDIPSIIEILDNFTYTFADSINKIHNNGSGFPPQNQITGETSISLSADHNYSGSTRIVLTDTQGNALLDKTGQPLVPLELDFDEFTGASGRGSATIEEIINEINFYYGSQPPQTVSIGSNLISSSVSIPSNPADGATVTIDGVDLTIDDTPAAGEVQRGGTLADTIDNIVAFMNSSSNPSNNTYRRYEAGSGQVIINTVSPIAQDFRIASLTSDINLTKATGSFTFSGNPSDSDTIDINGTTITFATSPASTSEVQIGSNLAETLTNLADVLNSSTDSNIQEASYAATSTTINITHNTAGTDPNTGFALDDSGTSVATASGANLSGGTDASGVFTFDFEFSNVDPTGRAITFDVTSYSVNGGTPVTPAHDVVTQEAGDRKRTERSSSSSDSLSISIGTDVGTTLSEGETFTIEADVLITDADGATYTETITFTVTAPDPDDQLLNRRFEATAISGSGEGAISKTSNTNAYLTASLVNQDGVQITDIGQPGFFSLAAGSGLGVIIDELDSAELGTTNNSTAATNRGFSHFLGLNNFFSVSETVSGSAESFSLKSDISTNPERLTIGTALRSTNITGDEVYSYTFGSSRNNTAVEFASAQDAILSFPSTSGLPAVNISVSDYTAEIYSFATSLANIAQSDYEKNQIFSDSLNQQIDDIGGVNLDEELANIIQTQTIYNSSARVISIIKELFETLDASLAS
jgi:flagellar hook-associated protein 1 FlgK